MSKLIETYNPQNAKALDAQQIEAMQHFSNEQIEELAAAYPNQPRGNNYLVLINTTLPANKQVYQLSTWKNLASLRRLNQKQFSAYSFKSVFDNNKTNLPKVGISLPAQVIDLSKQSMTDLPGFKPSEVATDPIISTEGAVPPNLVPTEDNGAAAVVAEGAAGSETVYDMSNPDIANAVSELKEQEAKLDQLKTDKAHHMTIKAQETKVEEVKEVLKALVSK
jgi:hypothetical protein